MTFCYGYESDSAGHVEPVGKHIPKKFIFELTEGY